MIWSRSITGETRDMFPESDAHVCCILDEGCSSTCHSSKWQAIEKLKWIGHWPPRRPRTSLRWIQKISKTVGLHAMPSSLTTRTGLNFAMQPWNPLNCQNGTCRFLVVVRSDRTGRLVKDLGQGADVERSCSPNMICLTEGLIEGHKSSCL